MPADAAALAAQLARDLLHRAFGVVQFWGLAVVRPNDDSYEVTSIHADGDRLDITYVHESHTGHAATLSIWSPSGIEPAPSGAGIAIRSAERLRFGDTEATSEGPSFRCKTPRGEGVLPKDGAPALVLAR
jgi:hypothetical protein